MGTSSSKSKRKSRTNSTINNNTFDGETGENFGNNQNFGSGRKIKNKSRSTSTGCCFPTDNKKKRRGDGDTYFPTAGTTPKHPQGLDGFESNNASVTRKVQSGQQKSKSIEIQQIEEPILGLNAADDKNISKTLSDVDSGVEEAMDDRRHRFGPFRPLQKNDKVVWLRNGRPKLALFKWYERIDGVPCAGLELEQKPTNPVAFHGQTGSKKFSCKPGHRAMVPMDQITLYEDYIGDQSNWREPEPEQISPTGSAVVVIQGPTRIESEADRKEWRHPPSQEPCWNEGDIIIFRESRLQAKILSVGLRERDNKLAVTLKYTPGSIREGDTEDRSLKDVMAVASVIRNAKKTPDKKYPPMSQRITTVTASIHADESFQSDYLEEQQSHPSNVTSYSQPKPKTSPTSSLQRERTMSMYSESSPPSQRAPSPPRPKVDKFRTQIPYSPQPSPQPWPTPPSGRREGSEKLAEIEKIPRVKEVKSPTVKLPERASIPRETDPKTEVSLKNIESPSRGSLIVSMSEPTLQVLPENADPGFGSGIDEVDVSYEYRGYNRDDELEYSKEWSHTHRKSQRQAAHKGIEAIFKRQIKAASSVASERESNVFAFRKSSLTDAAKFPKSEDLSKQDLPHPHTPARKNSLTESLESLDSPTLVRRAQSSMSGSNASSNENIFNSASVVKLSVRGIDSGKQSEKTIESADELKAAGRGDVGLEPANLTSEVPQTSGTSIMHTKRAKLTRQKPYPTPGTEVTSILKAERSEGDELESVGAGSKHKDERDVIDVDIYKMDYSTESAVSVSISPRIVEPSHSTIETMEVDVRFEGQVSLNRPRVGVSESQMVTLPEKGQPGPDRSSNKRRSRSTPYSGPPSADRRQRSSSRPLDKRDNVTDVSASIESRNAEHLDPPERPVSPMYSEVVKTGSKTSSPELLAVNADIVKPRSPDIFEGECLSTNTIAMAVGTEKTSMHVNDLKTVRENFPDAQIVFLPAQPSYPASAINQKRSVSEGNKSRTPPTTVSPDPSQSRNRSLPPVGNRHQFTSTELAAAISEPVKASIPVEIAEIPNGLRAKERVIWYSKSDTEEHGSVLRIFDTGAGGYIAVVRFENSKQPIAELKFSALGDGYEVPVENLLLEPSGITTETEKLVAEKPDERGLQKRSSTAEVKSLRPYKAHSSNGVYPPFETADIISGTCTGMQKGIQYESNSCYLDATIFSLFYCTDIFDDILLASRSTDNDLAVQVRTTLKSVVNRLRDLGFCSSKHMMELRNAMKPICNKIKGSFMDVEELMFKLFDDALHVPPFIHYSTDVSDHLTQLLIDTKDTKKCRTTQELLETSFTIQDHLKFKITPSPALILEMPRSDGELVHYKAIIPSTTLHISHLIKNDPCSKACGCGKNAVWECGKCVQALGGQSIVYCHTCKRDGAIGKIHHCLDHKAQPIRMKATTMELLAVICIRSKHYTTFVKSGPGPRAQWLFFDSMSGPSGEVKLIPELDEWLVELEQKPARYRDRDIPSMVRRLITNSHICIYYTPQTS